jgi:uncharacterized protein (TIGR03437 family)
MVPNVLNSTSILLTITVPVSNDPYLPFSGTGGPVVIGVCNPQGVGCSTPAASTTLTIGVNPIIQAVTSSSSYVQATAPALTAVAPYDILSVFGTAFCVSGGTGCTGSNSVLYGSTDPVTSSYPVSVSPDAAGATQRVLSVTFLGHGTSTVIATAPLLFATNNQINFLVPDAVKAYIGNTVDIVVSFGYGSLPATMFKSAPYSVTVAATNPGIFTIAGDGQGDAAALLGTALVSNTVPAGARSTATDSDIIALYVTGLGRPDSDGTANNGIGAVTCLAPDAYWAAVNTASAPSTPLTSDDGLVIQSALFPAGSIQPCVKIGSTLTPTVTIGGAAAVVKFAGWVADSVAGLYQINVQLPASTVSMTDAAGSSAALAAGLRHMPIVVTANSKSSQASGVNLAVVRRILVAAPSVVSGASTVLWTVGGTTSVVASEGTGAYTYATTDTLPAGLTFHADGTITGTPTTPGTTTITVTATDSGNSCTGTVTFTFTIT